MKDGTAVAGRKSISHNHVDLPPLVSLEAIGVCSLIGNIKVLRAAVCKSAGHAWNLTSINIADLLNCRHTSPLGEDLNAKHPFWNIIVSKMSGVKLLRSLDINDFEISAPQYPSHYSPAGNGDVLDAVVQKSWSLIF
jgi:hypothetical protein